ncbi:MAG TPA: LptA/OstA family protein, partial [Tepidisphaeraceae bacterium]
MRSIILLVVTLIVLAGAFAVFLTFESDSPAVQSGPTIARTEPAPTTASTQTESDSILGAGDGVWIQTYDKDTGVLLNEFRAKRYEPPQNGTVHVDRPEARFYSGNGQRLTLTADYGDVVMPDSGRKAQRLDSLDSGPPTRGTLHNVTLGLLENETATEPSITCTIPILAFDNEALKLNTVQTQIDGREVLADRVPVTVRGDYEFDGQGLTIRWNARDQRLEYLEITHGRRLVVKDIDAFGGLPSARGASPDDGLIELADADPAAVAAKTAAEESRRRAERRAAATRRSAAAQWRASAPVAYHAVFSDNVHVREGRNEIGTADRLTATFSFDKPEPATRPADAPATSAPAGGAAASSPATKPAARTLRAERSPATRPSEPIELLWTGKLTIVPKPLAEAGLKSSADRLIGFEGSPARLTRDGSGIVARKIVASTEGNRFTATVAPGEQVRLTDPSGLTLMTESLDFFGQTATLIGPSSAELPLPVAGAAAGATPQTMNLRWTDRATLLFAAPVGGTRVIRRATFDGAVAVTHPDLRLGAKSLGLVFDPKSTAAKPLLDRIEAQGDVAVTVREGAAERSVHADTLVAQARSDAKGAMSISGLDAQGHVRVQDGTRSLGADKLSAAFAEAAAGDRGTAPVAATISTLRAAGAVKLQDGKTNAAADELTLKTEGGVQTVRLKGMPAIVGDGASSLSGETINVRADGATAGVVGAGKLVGLTTPKDGAPPEPVEITWSDSFDYLAAENRVDLAGNVSARASGSDGAVLSAIGKRMRVDLADVAPKAGAAKPTAEGGALGGFGDKRIAGVTLSDDVKLSSVLADPKNPQHFLRRVFAFAPEVRVLLDAKGDPAGVSIPSGGQLLVDDPQPAVAAAAGQQTRNIEGAIAVQWMKSMTYDPQAKTVTLDGGVTVVYQRLGQDPLRLQSGRMIAEVNPAAGQRPVDRVRIEGGVIVSNK